MNGREHYLEAERLIGMARGAHEDDYADSPVVAHRLAEAQVHATLALTAATANQDHGEMSFRLADAPGPFDGDRRGAGPTWQSVTA